MAMKTDKELVLILHNIRSSYNVGSLLRTADAAGVGKVFLSGYTPSVNDRFGRINKALSKTALGAEKTTKIKKINNLNSLFTDMKRAGFKIIAIEQSKESTNYKKVHPARRTAFILGNEVRGLHRNILNKCDAIAEIPMKGKKESLNVSVAGGVAIFRIMGI